MLSTTCLGLHFYPNKGDTTNLLGNSKSVLHHFGTHCSKLSVSDYIWSELTLVSEDLIKHFLYAPYLMVIIDHVSEILFPKDVKHQPLKICYKLSPAAKAASDRQDPPKGGSSYQASSPPPRSHSCLASGSGISSPSASHPSRGSWGRDF